VLLSDVQVRTFELLGAIPLKWDLTEAIAGVKSGTIDAQENPFSNTVTYGVYKFHKFHTETNHVYLSRPIFLHRPSFDGWPDDLRASMRRAVADAVILQRGLVSEEKVRARSIIENEGGEIVQLTPDEHDAFVSAVAPVVDEFRSAHGHALFDLVPGVIPPGDP